MRIVQLNRDMSGELPAIRVVLLKPAKDVAQGAGHQEVLLHQAQFLTGSSRAGRIQHLGNGFGCDLLFHGFEIIAGIEDPHVEVM